MAQEIEISNKTVVDHRLPAPIRNDPLQFNPQPCCEVGRFLSVNRLGVQDGFWRRETE